MHRNIILIAILIALAIPAVCTATPPRPGGYFSGFIGASVASDTDATGVDFVSNVSFNDRVRFDPGIYIGGTGGYDFGMIRLEGELSYKQADLSSVTDSSGFRFRNIDGTLGALAMMANAFVDLHNDTLVTPYFGGGIGFASLHLSDTFGSDNLGPLLLYSGDDDTVFAYQAGAGLEISLNRKLSLDVGYRYFGTSKARFGEDRDIMTDMKLQSHDAAIGLRVKF